MIYILYQMYYVSLCLSSDTRAPIFHESKGNLWKIRVFLNGEILEKNQ